MKSKLFLLAWLLPVLLAVIGFILIAFVPGHSFLGFICVCLAIIELCYKLIDLLQHYDRQIFNIVRCIFTSLLCLGIALCCVTELIVLRASLGGKNANCPYVIVLGAKVNGTVPSLSLSDRISAAYAYLCDHPNTIAILSGGQGADESISEAQCMFDQLTKLGIEPNRLWLEDKATSTWENIRFSLDIIEENTGTRPESIGLLSSEYHLFRASLFAKDCGVIAIGIPAETSWFSLKLNYFTREVAGVWHYLILGGAYYD